MRTSLVLIAIAVTALATPVRETSGRWQPILDINDPLIKEIGAWVVAEPVKRANDGIRFGKVISGEEQAVSGLNYRLLIDAVNLVGQDGNYTVVVYNQRWTNSRELLYFTPATN